MWSGVLNKPNKGKGVREFRGYLMNVGVEYKNYIEK